MLKFKLFIILFLVSINYSYATDLPNTTWTFSDVPVTQWWYSINVQNIWYIWSSSSPNWLISSNPFIFFTDIRLRSWSQLSNQLSIDNSVWKLYFSWLNQYYCAYDTLVGVANPGIYWPVDRLFVCPDTMIWIYFWTGSLFNFWALDWWGQPPLYPTNQTKPIEYFKNVNSEYEEYIGKGNCLYTNPNNTIYEKPLQYCRASDFGELLYWYSNRYCEEWYNAYVNARIWWLDNFYIRSLVCANCNNESCIGNVKTNDSEYLNIQPFLTFWSILNFFYTWWVNNYWLQTGALSVEGILQNYPSWFMDNANDYLVYWYIIPPDIVRQNYDNVSDNSSPINYDISQSSTNSNWLEFKYYLDLNFEVCRTSHFLTCPLTAWLISDLRNYPAPTSDLYSSFKQYAYKLYSTWLTLPEIYETDPPQIILPSPSLSKTRDDSYFRCELSWLEWYEYLGWVVTCISNIAVWSYNSWVDFIFNAWWYFKKILDIGNVRTPTKTFWFSFIETAKAQTWDFSDIMWWFTKWITKTWWSNYNFYSNVMSFFEKAVYSLIFMAIISTFLFLYFKK